MPREYRQYLDFALENGFLSHEEWHAAMRPFEDPPPIRHRLGRIRRVV